MPINQASKDKSVVCISCGKVIAKGHIESGSIEIACKCGVKNRIEAENKPEGQKIPWRGVEINTTKNAFGM